MTNILATHVSEKMYCKGLRIKEQNLNHLVYINYFGLHNLQAGGATAAANLGINDRLFKKNGRWRSEKVKDGYIHESIEAKLKVTNNVGL